MYHRDRRTRQGNGRQLMIDRLNPVGVVLCKVLTDLGVDTRSWPTVAKEFKKRGFEHHVKKKEPEKAQNPYYQASKQNLSNWFAEEQGEAPDSFWIWFLEAFDLYREDRRTMVRDLGEVRLTRRIPPGYPS